MKKHKRITIDGKTYEYYIMENGKPCVRGLVPYEIMQKIEKELEKKKRK